MNLLSSLFPFLQAMGLFLPQPPPPDSDEEEDPEGAGAHISYASIPMDAGEQREQTSHLCLTLLH